MRIIDSALQSAISAAASMPAVTCTIAKSDPPFAPYQSLAGVEARVSACVAHDGSVVRAHIPQSGGASQPIAVQRITDPAQASQWSAWSALSGASAMNASAGVCVVANSDGVVWLFAQSYGGSYPVQWWRSNDNGQTWSGPANLSALPTAPTNVRGLASSGNNDLFALYDTAGGVQIAYAAYSGSSWGIWLESTLAALSAGAGLAVTYDHASSLFFVAAADGSAIAASSLNPGTWSWSALPVIVPASASGVQHLFPSLARIDQLYCLCYTEIDAGNVTSLVYSRPRLIQSRDFLHWSDGYPLGISCALACVWFDAHTNPPAGSAGPAQYVAGDLQIWRAPHYDATDPLQYIDVSARVLSFQRRERASARSELELVLDNADGAINRFFTAGNGAFNALITLSEGYLVNGMPDTVQTGLYRLETITFRRTPDTSQIEITASDPTKWLKWQARTMRAYAGQTLGWLIAEVAARANIPLAPLPNTPQMGQIVASFVIPTGTTLMHALKELCGTYDLYWLYDQTNGLTIRELNSGDGINWSYHPDWFALSLGYSDDHATHVIITGRPLSVAQLCAAEYVDYTMSAIDHQDRVLHVAMPRITTNAQASIKATLMMGDEQRSRTAHQVTVAGNPALQVLDVVQLTDDFLGLTFTGRIAEIHVTYEAQRALYLMTCAAEAV